MTDTATFPPPPPPSAGGKKWKLTWGDRSWTEDDLTGAHASCIALLAGRDSWELLDPQAGPMALLGTLAAFIALADNADPAAVVGELAARPVSELLESLTFD